MISAIILAAGESKRMGVPKMLLQWGETTVLEHVISVFAKTGIKDILIITGAHKVEIEKVISKSKTHHPVRSVFNENFSDGEMLSSIQCGIQELSDQAVGAAVIGLGDQPQVQKETVRSILNIHQSNENLIIVPSFEMKRGHPWLIPRRFWKDILDMKPPLTLRDFLALRAALIHYVIINNPSILTDLDTPQDYENYRPK